MFSTPLIYEKLFQNGCQGFSMHPYPLNVLMGVNFWLSFWIVDYEAEDVAAVEATVADHTCESVKNLWKFSPSLSGNFGLE